MHENWTMTVIRGAAMPAHTPTWLRVHSEAAPEVGVFIANYNGLHWLPRCLSSVLRTKYPNYRVYLVENGSVDGSAAYTRETYPSVEILPFDRNLGLAEAYNRAVAQTPATYLLFLNNDTEVLNPRWLDELVQHAIVDQDVGAVASKMVSIENHTELDSVGGMGIPYWRGFTDIGKAERDVGQYREDFEPFSYCGGGALITKAAFFDAGKLDDRMFLYFEDSDLSWRLRLRGWKIRYSPLAKIAHASGGSTGGGRGLTTFRLYYCHRNLLRSIIKNCGDSLWWALKNYLLFSLLAISGFLLYDTEKAIVILRGICWNIRNLQTSYSLRLATQSRRRVSEQEILKHMYPLIQRNVPPQHENLRRILDVLFEYSNQGRFQSRLEKSAPSGPR